MTDPLVRHLCEDATFLYDEDFAAHKETVHLEVVPRATPAREWQHLSLRQP